jgi:hypothetical protein
MANIIKDGKVFADNIRKIAKTDEIKEQVNRLTIDLAAAVKGGIGLQRSVAYLSGSGSANAVAGAVAGAGSSGGTDNTGNPVVGDPAPPLNLSVITDLIRTAIDAANISKDLDNIKWQNGTSGTDLSDRVDGDEVDDPKAGGMGTQFTDQGLLGENNPDWLAIKAALIAKGATAEEIAKARREFLKKALGIDEIGDVFNGDAGPKPKGEDFEGNALSETLPSEVLNGLVGVAAGNHGLVMLVRLDDYPTRPTNADAAAQNQNPWSDGETPPIKKSYYPGAYFIGGGSYTNDSQAAVEASIAALDVAEDFISWDTLSPADVSGAHLPGGNEQYNLGFTATRIGGGLPVNGSIFMSFCDRSAGVPVEAGVVCIAAPPVETAYPTTGSATLKFKNGHFEYSPFDSEVPIEYRGTHSVTTIHSLVTGLDYDIFPAINGGVIVQDTAKTEGHFLYYSADRTLKYPIDNQYLKFYSPRRA